MIQLRSLALVFSLACAFVLPPSAARAEDNVEKAGVGIGVTAGNMLFLPIKAISVGIGALAGALSFVVTGGDREVAGQIWRDTAEGPYAITREVARTAIGHRPEDPALK
jgi:hypothetical protein